MTAAALNTLINFKCRTNDTTFTQADKLVLVNLFKDEIASQIEEVDSGYFLIPSTFDLVANQREYAIGDDLLNSIQKVEIKFDASNSRYPAAAIKDYYGSETESEIVKQFGNAEGEFAYTIRRRALFILSGTIANTTAGGRIWAHIFPANLANLTDSTDDLSKDPTTTSFGFPRQFHELLARRVAIEYKSKQPKPIPLAPMEKNYYNDLKVQLDAISKNDNSLEVVAELPASNSPELGNDGWDF